MKNLSCFLCLLFLPFFATAYNIECVRTALQSDYFFARSTFTDINNTTTIDNLSDIYIHLNTATDSKLVKSIEAQRLINQGDWRMTRQSMSRSAHRAYGDSTIDDWFKGREYVLSLPKDQKIDSDLLKEIHKIVSKNHKFHGFEGRRIRQRFENGEISHAEFKALLNKAYKENEEVAGVPHSSLRGLYRHEAVDQVIHKGSRFAQDGSRYFTQAELNALRKNPYITLDESSIKKISENTYTGTARYAPPQDIPSAVDNILQTTESKLRQAKTQREVVEIVVTMSKDLISVHPFLDGNGRTVRLLGDYILRRHDLPPSLYPNEADLTMSLNEAVNFQVKGMKDWLREHQNHLIANRTH